MSASVSVRRWRNGDIGLEAALEATFPALPDGTTLIGLCSAPTACRFARLFRANGTVRWDWGGPPDLDPKQVFDLRAFVPGGCFELRWRATGTTGVAAWVTTDGAFDPESLSGTTERLADVTVAGTIPSRRLLFGELRDAPPPAPGWAVLREGRIGQICVPLDAAQARGTRIEIRGEEFVAREARYGNAFVADELLTGLDWTTEPNA